MGKKFMRKTSKRTTTRQVQKQQKKLREHNAKVRRDKKKNPKKYSKSKKDPGVPNSCPFKEDVLKEVEAGRHRKQEMRDKKRDEMKQRREEAKERELEEKRTKGLVGLVADAEMKQANHESQNQFVNEISNGIGKMTDRSAKAYYREFTKVMEAADVVLQVCDARDPMGTRCKQVEEAVMNNSSKGKRLVLILNKADLVPKENLEKWLKYLRRELPAIPFKASTQTQSNRLGQSNLTVKKSSDEQLQTSKCVGAGTLTTLLANYCRNKDVKTSIRVGVVGLPNVGKSSLINSLKRSKACVVGATPGVTKSMQEVQLDSKVKLLDSPGMVLASGDMSNSSVALRNAIKVESLEDPITPVEAILNRCPKEQMMLQYGISSYEDTNEFLSLVARSMGRLKKGGVPDQIVAARIVLNDWNCGKIKYHTFPPEDNISSTTENEVVMEEAQIVSEFAKEFCLDDLNMVKMESEDIANLPNILPSQTMAITTSGILEQKDCDLSDIETSDKEDSNNEYVGKENILSDKISIGANKQKQSKSNQASTEKSPKFQEESLLRLKKAAKIREKKEKKERKRRDKVAADLSHGMEAAFETL